MFARKKVSDLEPKYNLLERSSLSGYYGAGIIEIHRFQNSVADAKVLTVYVVTSNYPSQIIIDFKNDQIYQDFLKLCNDEVKLLIKPITEEELEAQKQNMITRGIVNKEGVPFFTTTKPTTCQVELKHNITVNEKLAIIKTVFSAIHSIDPLDIKNIEILEKEYPGVKDVLNSEEKLEQEKKLEQAYCNGAMFGLFANIGMPIELGGETKISKEDGLNVALTNSLSAEWAAAETSREVEKILRRRK